MLLPSFFIFLELEKFQVCILAMPDKMHKIYENEVTSVFDWIHVKVVS